MFGGEVGEAYARAGHTTYGDTGEVGVDDQVVGGHLQPIGCQFLRPLDEFAGGLLHRCAALLQTARTARPATLGDEIGVAPENRDPVDRDAGLVAGEHRPHRRVTLAVR